MVAGPGVAHELLVVGHGHDRILAHRVPCLMAHRAPHARAPRPLDAAVAGTEPARRGV